MPEIPFDDAFKALTGNPPFPWQQALYERFKSNDFPTSCNLPTGLGKTSVVAIWLIALANHPSVIPRRLVYVVNRRTVVDQTTDEVMKYRMRLGDAGPPETEVHAKLAAFLTELSSSPNGGPLALSTLRGQFADNREWSADPSRPAVIVGTVDMIGSRLLFSGYGVGFKGKPLHAGFLGQDVLLVHDEAHLEPAFQELLLAIEMEQRVGEKTRELPWPKLRVMELSATPRSGGDVFGLTLEEKQVPAELPETATKPIHHVWLRTHSKKALHLHPIADEKKQLVPTIVTMALRYKDEATKPAVVIFVRTVEAVNEVIAGLRKGKVSQDNILPLTGTIRGWERDRMATENPVFARFKKSLPVSDRPSTVYLVCTSAGEVGVDISADHLICDLSTFDSMAQRFGRVNRYGVGNAAIDVVYPTMFDSKNNPFDVPRELTLGLLQKLRHRSDGVRDASPSALSEMIERAVKEGSGQGNTPTTDQTEALRKFILAAFAPAPVILQASDILFDAWALTTIRDKLPGRPKIETYLHGVEDEKSFDTEFAWRQEVELLTGKVRSEVLAEWIDEFPLKPHESLRMPTFGKRRAYEHLEMIAARCPDVPAWVIEPDGKLTTYEHLSELVAKQGKDYVVPLAARTVVLPPKAGGLNSLGTLDGEEEFSDAIHYDVAGIPPQKVTPLLRLQVKSNSVKITIGTIAETKDWPAKFIVEFDPNDNEYEGKNWLDVFNNKIDESHHSRVKPVYRLDLKIEEDSSDDSFTQYVVVRPIASRKAAVAAEWPALGGHLTGVQKFADAICTRLKLEPRLAKAVSLAAAWHDLGKGRAVWQRGAGNKADNSPIAKTLHGRPPENLNHYRHELGSMIDVVAMPQFAEEFLRLDSDQRELTLHLIATHHGRGRAHFPTSEAYDPERSESLVGAITGEVSGRFARLQNQYGRWGLAYLESLLRASDISESQRIEAAPIAPRVPGSWPERAPKLQPYAALPSPKPSITIAVDPTNPGQFFACCGLLELADRFWPGAEGWFEKGAFCVACEGTLNQLLDAFMACRLTNTMTEVEHARAEELKAWGGAKRKKTPGAEDEYAELGKLLREAPLVLEAPLNLTLDWFVDDYAGGSRFKTWAGQQGVLAVATTMKDALKGTAWQNEACLTFAVTGCGLPFNFDSDLGGQGGAIDVGFSFDPLAGSALTRIESMARPALELLAFIGLQRFRPTEIKGENRFLYTAWNRPLPIAVAMPAACGAMPSPSANRYEFRLLYRTKYLKSFLPAIPFSGGSDE